MMRAVHCECGETSMLDGHCIGCKRIRPSSSEKLAEITILRGELIRKRFEYEKIIKLEEKEKENKNNE